MKKLNITGVISAILFTFLIIAGCKPDVVTKPDPIFSGTNLWIVEQNAVINYGLPGQPISMEQAFRQGYILVYGEGLPKQDSSGKGQRKLTAQRSAEVVAQKNLSDMLSNNGQYDSIRFDTFTAQIKPRLSGFKIVSAEYNDVLGKAVVLIRFDLHGATRIVR